MSGSAAQFFDEWSIYDRVLDRDYMFHDAIYRDVGLLLVERYAGRSFAVLDLGCGSARHFSRALAGRSVSRYAGYDLSDVALAHARPNLARLGCPLDLRQGDLLEGLQADGERFDLIFCGFSLHHLSAADKERFFQSAFQRLEEGGLLLVVDTMREAEESRSVYLDRYLGWIRSEWKAMSAAELDAICEHIRNNDFPDTAASLRAMAARAGFDGGSEVSRFRWHHTLAFEKKRAAEFRIRAARLDDAGAIARAHVDSWRTTYAGILPDAYIAGMSYEARERAWRKNLAGGDRDECVYLAENEKGEVAGFASGGPERSGDAVYRGELYAIYLLQRFQRRGAGRQLTRAVARRLFEAGHASMLVWVLVDNPAAGFYAALGGEVVAEKPVEIGAARLLEAAYGWKDLRLLIG
ncbi:MAG TPA: GNAT family N-acetyltransferase [Candidatus Binatia bacterium]